MESFQKRSRERRKREKQVEKQARRQERNATRELRGREGDPADSPSRPALSLNSPTDVAPAARPNDERPPT